MSATVLTAYGTTGTIDNDVITSEDRRLILALRQIKRSSDSLQYVPDADLEVAQTYVDQFGGRIVDSGPGTEGDPIDRVY